MGFPAGVSKIAAFKIAANASYPTSSSEPVNFNLSQCSEAWWDAVTDLSDIVVYDAVSDMLRPRYICPLASIVAKTGWGTCDSAVSLLGRTLYLCVVPGAGAVNAAAAHTNSGCFSAHGFDVTSGNIPDKTGAYTGTTNSLTYDQTGLICKSASFDGDDATVDIGNVTQLNSVSQFTVGLLVNWRNVTQIDNFFKKELNATNMVKLRSGTSRFYCHVGAGSDSYAYVDVASTGVSINTWFTAFMVYNGGLSAADRVKLYINGAVQEFTGSGGGAFPEATSDLSAATAMYGAPVQALNGYIDEGRLFSRALSVAEIFMMDKNLRDHANFATYSDYSLSRNVASSLNIGIGIGL
jgi:hypothetical protein